MKIFRGVLIIVATLCIVIGYLFKILHWVFAEYINGKNLITLGSLLILLVLFLTITKKQNPKH